MKIGKILFISFLATVCIISACNDKDSRADDTPTIVLLGERTCTGDIVWLPNPPDGSSEPTLPGLVLGLKTNSRDYLLSYNGKLIWKEPITIGGVSCSVGDKVEITGMETLTKISASEKYYTLKIETIRKHNGF